MTMIMRHKTSHIMRTLLALTNNTYINFISEKMHETDRRKTQDGPINHAVKIRRR